MFWVAIDGVWIGNWIYWTLTTTSNCSVVTNSHTLQLTTACTKVFSACCVFTSLLVVASSGGLSPLSGFQSVPGLNPWLTTHLPTNSFHSTNWLTNSSLTVLLISSLHGPHRKHRSSVAVYGLMPSNGCCLVVCFAVVA
jgi:hypothetical protein